MNKMEWMDVLMWGKMKEEAKWMKGQAMHIQHSFAFIYTRTYRFQVFSFNVLSLNHHSEYKYMFVFMTFN